VTAAVFVDMKFASESLVNSQIQQVTTGQGGFDLPDKNPQVPGNNSK